LKQRIALRSQLEPLNLEETRGYIQRRLQLASGNSPAGTIFPEETIVEIHRHSRGIPRLINTVCENGLINAYARQLQQVTPEIIIEVAVDFRLDVVHQVPTQTVTKQDNQEVWHAVKTLLQLHDYLQGMRPRDEEPPVATRSGASKHEPYI